MSYRKFRNHLGHCYGASDGWTGNEGWQGWRKHLGLWAWHNEAEVCIGSGNGLAPSHYLNQCWSRSMMPIATLGHKELICQYLATWVHYTRYYLLTIEKWKPCDFQVLILLLLEYFHLYMYVVSRWLWCVCMGQTTKATAPFELILRNCMDNRYSRVQSCPSAWGIVAPLYVNHHHFILFHYLILIM